MRSFLMPTPRRSDRAGSTWYLRRATECRPHRCADSLHGISTSRPRRRHDSSPRNLHAPRRRPPPSTCAPGADDVMFVQIVRERATPPSIGARRSQRRPQRHRAEEWDDA
mmetsp:Transcript_27677/g.85550  ORF Transcript_27677/g.85550 Transcript_27677/m.85550 type:complete len:110 (-) Transcript_27677:123-452(-)